MFPATTLAPFARNVVRRGILAIFFSVFKFCEVLSSFLTVFHGIRDGPCGERGCWVPEAPKRTTVRPLSTRDASTFPPGPSHSDGVPHVSHVLIKVRHVFHALSRLSTDETWTPGSFGSRLCPRYKKKASQAIKYSVKVVTTLGSALLLAGASSSASSASGSGSSSETGSAAAGCSSSFGGGERRGSSGCSCSSTTGGGSGGAGRRAFKCLAFSVA